MVKVRVLRRYTDVELARKVFPGDEFEVSEERASHLVNFTNPALVTVLGVNPAIAYNGAGVNPLKDIKSKKSEPVVSAPREDNSPTVDDVIAVLPANIGKVIEDNLLTYADLVEKSEADLCKLRGIGGATAKKIKAAVNSL